MRRLDLLLIAAALGAVIPSELVAQHEVVGHAVMLSQESASVAFDLADGNSRLITVGEGRVTVDGAEVATYDAGSGFGASWLSLLESNSSMGTYEMLHLVRDWADALETSGGAALLDAVADLEATPATDTPGAVVTQGGERIEIVIPSIPDMPPIELPEIAVGTGTAGFEVAQSGGGIATSPSILGSMGTGLLSLLASWVALSLMGFGFLIFAPRQLRAVGDTVWSSFGRSFLAGFFAQPLLVPALGALLAALALTVIGILLIPVAIPAFALAIFLSVSGGYLAIARGIGEIYLRRRNHGITPSAPWIEMKFVLYGLSGLLAIWLPAILLGWIPVVGSVFTILAAILTWILATAGFGASIISRGGVRGTVMRRLDRTLSESDYWADTGSFKTSRSMSEF